MANSKNIGKNYMNYDTNNDYTEKEIERAKQKADKNQKRSKGNKKGFIIAIILLSIVVVGLATWLLLMYFAPKTNTELENSYKKSYYEAVSCIDNMDVNLSKILATKDEEALQKYLTTLAINAELCENNMQQLPLLDESKYYTVKLINQIGDYSKYLNEKLIDGQSITSEERQSLQELYKGNLALKNSLQQINKGLNAGYTFSELVSNKDSDIVLKNFNNLQELSVSYPELIYDGPFSDGDTYQNIRGNNGNKISYLDAVLVINNGFENYHLTDVIYIGETNGELQSYDFTAKSYGREVSIKVAKNGGNIIMFTMNLTIGESKYNSEECVKKAQTFIESLGYTNMSPVWNTNSNGIEVINFVYENNGILFYPDMVKVNVSHDTLEVTGIECSKYYINHYDRSIESAKIGVDSARKSVFDDIEILNERLVVIPKGNNSEELAYEFMGTIDNSVYYVFISANTGKQVKMFKVINSTNGDLLI